LFLVLFSLSRFCSFWALILGFSIQIPNTHLVTLLKFLDLRCLRPMSPVLSEILRSGFIIDSSLRRRTHLVQSFSVVFLYWFYVFS
jgi:hypothetical protein